MGPQPIFHFLKWKNLPWLLEIHCSEKVSLKKLKHQHTPIPCLQALVAFKDFLKVLCVVAGVSVVVMYCVKSALPTPVAASRNKCFQKRLYVKPCKTKALAVLWINFKKSIINC